jgi:hypothetical protein
MNNLWTFGCSFTAEYDTIDGQFHPFKNNYDRYRDFRGGELPDIWPTILAKKINYNLVNCALGGSSNYRILMQFSDVCDKIKKDDILIFGWTQKTRFLAANFSQDIFNDVLPIGASYPDLQFSQKTIDEILVNRTHNLWSIEVMKWIRMINTFVKSVGAEVYHWTSDDTIFTIENNIVKNNESFIIVDDSEFLQSELSKDKHSVMWFLTHPKNYGGIQMGKIIDETKGLVEDGHMGEYGHKVQANYFYKHIVQHTKINKIKNT